jgi:hypothetical protein
LLFSLQNLTFDVKDILSGNENARKLLEKYQSDSNIPVTEKDRNSIINIVLGYVINEIGHYYPKLPTKEKLAAAIVAAFLQMGLVPSHANIYSSATANKHCEMDGIKGGGQFGPARQSQEIYSTSSPIQLPTANLRTSRISFPLPIKNRNIPS